ncbi:hypothetical protein DH2020_043461 [Rehmannia glutinosa]|uniref:Uncharacterized protein n=1 Tax=Rehmannia glutinosa TaxID=99300 RepID=A0ABR0UJK3_REHGL
MYPMLEQRLDTPGRNYEPLWSSIRVFRVELFPETLQNSEVASISSNNNCCYEEHSSYQTNLSITMDTNKYNSPLEDHNEDINPPADPKSPATTTTTAADPTRNSNQPIIFLEDQLDNNDISASIDFTTSPSFSVPHQHYFNNNNNNNDNDNNQETFTISSFNHQISLGDDDGQIYTAHHYNPERRPGVGPVLGGPPLPMGFNEESMSSGTLPSYFRLSTSSPPCTLIDQMNIGQYLPSSSLGGPFSFDNPGIFNGGAGLFLGNDISHQELEFQGDNGGIFQPDSLARVFSCSTGDLQALSSESQHLLHGSPSTTLASEISSFEDPNFKVGKLSVEERKRKIHRYLQKRNERNFSKKIKNDELAELARNTNATNHEDDTDEDLNLFSNIIPDQHKVVKEEEDMDSSEIFAHINSFKCNYPIQSWI